MRREFRYVLPLVLVLVNSVTQVPAQDVDFKASAPSVVATGEPFEVVYTLNARPEQFRQPEFSPFELLGGPSTSTSTSVQMIGTQIRQNITVSYTYYLRANSTGKFEIPPAQATIKGKNFSSNSLSIEVVKGSTPASQSQQGVQSPSGEEAESIKGGKDLFAAFLVDKRTVYLGEPLIVTLKIYDRMGLSRLAPPKLPALQGFYKNDIPTPELRQLSRENVNGQIYNTGVIARFILYPQKTGDLTIGSVEFNGAVQRTVTRRSRSWFDFDFDFPTIQEQPVTFRSEPVTIRVKPLPPGQPANFSGTVGDLSMAASIDKPELNTNDALTLKIKLTGKANMKMINPPVVSFPADFDAYPPKANVQEEYTTEGTTGSVTFEYIAIPRHPGTFTIPPVSFSYFSPRSNEYKTLASQPFSVTVNKGREDTTITVVSGLSREDVRLLNQDIRYIKRNIPDWKNKQLLLDSHLFILWYVAPLVLFALLIGFRRKTIRERADAARMRHKRAARLAAKRLRKAEKAMKNQQQDEFYEEILKAIWGYLSDKLMIPLANLSRDNAWQALSERGISGELKEQLGKILDTCELARFAPAGTLPSMKETYENAVVLMEKIDQNLK